MQTLSNGPDNSPKPSSWKLDTQANVNKTDEVASSSQPLISNMAIKSADSIKSTDSVGTLAGMRDSNSDTDMAIAGIDDSSKVRVNPANSSSTATRVHHVDVNVKRHRMRIGDGTNPPDGAVAVWYTRDHPSRVYHTATARSGGFVPSSEE